MMVQAPGWTVPIKLMAWALSYGACLGGNATLVGSAANVVACGISKQRGYPISMKSFSRLGLPIMLISVMSVYIYSLIRFVAIGNFE